MSASQSYFDPAYASYSAAYAPATHAPVDRQQQQQYTRLRITHATPQLTAFYANCSLKERLQYNTQIEAANAQKRFAHIAHLQNPTQNPPADDLASILTIRDDEWTLLRSPSFVAGLGITLPFFVLEQLARLRVALGGAPDTAGRRTQEDRTDTRENTRQRWRFVDSSRIQARNPGVPVPISFPDIWYNTAAYTLIPQSFFLTSNIHFINNNIGSRIPLVRSGSSSRGSSGTHILAIDRIRRDFPALFRTSDLDLSLAEWDESAANHCRFEASRDRDGESGPHALMYSEHYGFFFHQPDRIQLYEHWLPIELEIKAQLHTSPAHFDVSFYDNQVVHFPPLPLPPRPRLMTTGALRTRATTRPTEVRFCVILTLISSLFVHFLCLPTYPPSFLVLHCTASWSCYLAFVYLGVIVLSLRACPIPCCMLFLLPSVVSHLSLPVS